jgi:carbonic anhydrase
MKNLLTYPYVREKYDAGTLNIYGWYYILETGELFNFNDENAVFELVS